MSLPKLCLFALAATLAGFAAVETLKVDIKGIRGAGRRAHGRTIRQSRLTAHCGTPDRGEQAGDSIRRPENSRNIG